MGLIVGHVTPQRPIIVAAGGTGGHLFPAEALASELITRGERVALMTDARSAAFSSSAFAGAERHVLRGGGLAGLGVFRAAKGLLGMAAGTFEARAHLDRLRAAAVVGFGGYASVPPVLAARSLPGARRPVVVLHEQNAVLGRANRLLARTADLLALSIGVSRPSSEATRTENVGNPVRPAFATLVGEPYMPPTEDGPIRLLVLGGSLGARIFADVLPAAVAALPFPIRNRLVVAQQCRPEDVHRVRDTYSAVGVPAELSPFFPDVCGRLSISHLVVARAGASTVAELACAGRPAILVPLPHAIDDHQTANARALVDAEAAWLAPQASMTPESLSTQLASLFASPTALSNMAAAAARRARPDAAQRLADAVLSLIRSRAASVSPALVLEAP